MLPSHSAFSKRILNTGEGGRQNLLPTFPRNSAGESAETLFLGAAFISFSKAKPCNYGKPKKKNVNNRTLSLNNGFV